MTNFSPTEFSSIWSYIQDHVSSNWNVARDRKSAAKAKDVFFMVLKVIKHCGQWELLGQTFKMKGPTFENLIIGVLRIVWESLYSGFVIRASEKWYMHRNVTQKEIFENFPYAGYAVDVTFQQSYRPSVSLQIGKLFFSEKHKPYGYKAEVHVLPKGLAIGCSPNYSGSVSDIVIFNKTLHFHTEALKKPI